MKLRSVLQFSTVAMALVSGTALVAQVTTGALSGTVRDNKGRPVANARVSLSSPALFNPRVIMTDANGEWHAPLLPIGNYRVQVSLSGYVGSEARDVRVGIGSTVRQDLNLKPISVSEKTVEVVAEAGEVDKAATSTATNFSAEVLETMAGSDRSFNGAADLSPGVATASNGQFTVRGGQTQNTLFRVNGSDVKDDYQGGLTSTWVIEDNIEDVQVVLSPLNARNGRAISGQVNVVTKTGGNDFAGSIRAVVNRPSWAAMTPYSQNLPGQVSDNLSRQFDVTFSGPIVKDRLWFSFGTILTPSSSTSYQIPAASSLAKQSERSGIPAIDNQFDGLTPTNVPAGYSFASGLLGIQPYTQVYNANYYEGKITGAISQDHTLEASFTYSSDSIAGRDPYGDGNSILRRLQQLGTQTDKAHQYGLHYSGVFNSTTFLEAKYNRFLSQAIYPQGDPNFKSDAVDLWLDTPNGAGHNWTDVGYPFGLGITPRPDARNNESWNINLKLFRGSGSAQHEIDLGVESYMSDRDTSRSQGQDNAYFRVGGAFYNPNASGQSAWLFPVIPWQGPRVNGQSGSGNSGLAPILEQFLGKDGTTKNITRSLYANDNITFNSHWNMMVGLRFDQITAGRRRRLLAPLPAPLRRRRHQQAPVHLHRGRVRRRLHHRLHRRLHPEGRQQGGLLRLSGPGRFGPGQRRQPRQRPPVDHLRPADRSRQLHGHQLRGLGRPHQHRLQLRGQLQDLHHRRQAARADDGRGHHDLPAQLRRRLVPAHDLRLPHLEGQLGLQDRLRRGRHGDGLRPLQ